MKVIKKFGVALVGLAFLVLFILGGLSGCKPESQLAARVAVQYAVGKYIEKVSPIDKVEKVRRIIETARLVSQLAENESVTIDSLRAYVAQRLADRLSPADRLLAGAIIDAAAIELKNRVGDGVLKPDQLVQVREVLTWVEEAATAYAPPEAGS